MELSQIARRTALSGLAFAGLFIAAGCSTVVGTGVGVVGSAITTAGSVVVDAAGGAVDLATGGDDEPIEENEDVAEAEGGDASSGAAEPQ